MIPNFRPIHLAFEKTSSCISLKHIATITIPRSKYKVHNAALPPLSVPKVFFPGTKSPNPE